MKFIRRALAALFFASAAGLSVPTEAQDYPNRPVTIVVPLAAGSGMDSLVRLY
jgi:tripartite-type tricarboxylate transporter receptor subunit TctC